MGRIIGEQALNMLRYLDIFEDLPGLERTILNLTPISHGPLNQDHLGRR